MVPWRLTIVPWRFAMAAITYGTFPVFDIAIAKN
jgi:hypothetical protein